MSIEHRRVNVGRLNLHVAELGSGPAVLLLHGFPAHWADWRTQMRALASAGFRAIAPDLAGLRTVGPIAPRARLWLIVPGRRSGGLDSRAGCSEAACRRSRLGWPARLLFGVPTCRAGGSAGRDQRAASGAISQRLASTSSSCAGLGTYSSFNCHGCRSGSRVGGWPCGS